jgi:hypothetical protein
VKPLQAVAMGLVVVLLNAPVNGYDLLPDPGGWVLVLIGLSWLAVPQRRTLRTLATVSLVVSVVVWIPSARAELNLADKSLAWAASIPEILTILVLVHALAGAAGSAGDRSARSWLLTMRLLMLVVLLLPPVALGGGVHALVVSTAVVSNLSLVLLVVLLFRYSGRPWAEPAKDVIRSGRQNDQNV